MRYVNFGGTRGTGAGVLPGDGESLHAFDILVQKGKMRYIGVST